MVPNDRLKMPSGFFYTISIRSAIGQISGRFDCRSSRSRRRDHGFYRIDPVDILPTAGRSSEARRIATRRRERLRFINIHDFSFKNAWRDVLMCVGFGMFTGTISLALQPIIPQTRTCGSVGGAFPADDGFRCVAGDRFLTMKARMAKRHGSPSLVMSRN